MRPVSASPSVTAARTRFLIFGLRRGRRVGPAEAVGLVDQYLHRELRRPGLVEDLAFALLHRLAGVEQPKRGVRLLERATGSVGVTRVGGVEAGSVEDLHPREGGDREQDLDAPNLRRVDRLQHGPEVEDGRDSLRRLRTDPKEDSRDRIGAVAKVVERGGRGQDPHRGNLLPDDRVDERALSGVELTDDGEPERAPALRGEPGDARRRFEVVEGTGDLLQAGQKKVPTRGRVCGGPGAGEIAAKGVSPRHRAWSREGRELVEERIASPRLRSLSALRGRRTDGSQEATPVADGRVEGGGARVASVRVHRADRGRERRGVVILERSVEERPRGPGFARADGFEERPSRFVPAALRARESGPVPRERRLAAGFDDGAHAGADRLVARDPSERRRERLARPGRVQDGRSEEGRECGRVGSERVRASHGEIRPPVGGADLDPSELGERSVGVSARKTNLGAPEGDVGRAVAGHTLEPEVRSLRLSLRKVKIREREERFTPRLSPGSATSSARTNASRTSARGAPVAARARASRTHTSAREGTRSESSSSAIACSAWSPAISHASARSARPSGDPGTRARISRAAARARAGSPRVRASSPSRRGISAPPSTTSTRPSQRPTVSARRTLGR